MRINIRHVTFLLVFGVSTIRLTSLVSQAPQDFVPGQLIVKFQPGTPQQVIDQVNAGIGATILSAYPYDPDLYLMKIPLSVNLDIALSHYTSDGNVVYAERNLIVGTPGQDFVPGQLIVKFQPGTPQSVIDQINSPIEATVISVYPYDPDVYLMNIPSDVSLGTAITYYASDDRVVYAERNSIAYPTERTPNDPLFPPTANFPLGQWGLKNTGQGGGTAGADIRATFAWDTRTGDPGMAIAVIDTGVDYNHPDLLANVWTNQGEAGIPNGCTNGVDDDINGYIDDCKGWDFVDHDKDPMDGDVQFSHGTHVAGIIAASGNNGAGVAGIMWQAKIMPLRAIPGDVFFTLGPAIDYASSKGAKISNNSWACSSQQLPFLCNSALIKDAVKRAETAGQLFVAGAGNANINVDGGIFGESRCREPRVANEPCNIIGVAASDQNDARWFDSSVLASNWGPGTIHIAAPGRNVLSTLRQASYGLSSGTSMATPHVTGVAGLMRSQNPSYNQEFTKQNLLLAHRPLNAFAPPGTTRTITGGIVNADHAINAFGDSFDYDTLNNSRFFSAGGTGARWAVAQNGAARCDLFVKTLDSLDRVSEVQFFDRAGDVGSNWTLGSYKASYAPGGQPQTVKIRVATVDGSSFSGKKGRIAVGFIGQMGLTTLTCSQTGLTYGRHSFTASAVAGVNLDSAQPFWESNPPYTFKSYAAVPITSLTKMTISVKFALSNFTLAITNSDTGAQLFTVTESYPTITWSGTHVPAFEYYGATDGSSGVLYVRDFVSTRPAGAGSTLF